MKSVLYDDAGNVAFSGRDTLPAWITPNCSGITPDGYACRPFTADAKHSEVTIRQSTEVRGAIAAFRLVEAQGKLQAVEAIAARSLP